MQQALTASGVSGTVSLQELSGATPLALAIADDTTVTAASTYKLPLLMQQAQGVASGKYKAADKICYKAADADTGWFTDYAAGKCYTRLQLAQRTGQFSDNVAARMLVRSIGGAGALNTYARAHGAKSSAFYDPNTTTAADLTRLWVNEAHGSAGGRAAQDWLYPLLINTQFEQGIPAGVPSGYTAVHKNGEIGAVTIDSALVIGAGKGPYVLTITLNDNDTDAWPDIAKVSQLVAAYEAAR